MIFTKVLNQSAVSFGIAGNEPHPCDSWLLRGLQALDSQFCKGAVMLSLRFFSTKLQSKHCFFNLFLCCWLKIFTLKINTLQVKLQISEK